MLRASRVLAQRCWDVKIRQHEWLCTAEYLSPPVFQLLSINVFKPTVLLSISTSPTTPPCLSHPSNSFPLSRLSCCAAMQWIDRLAWLQILPPNRHKSSPEREPTGRCAALLKVLSYPRELQREAKEQEGKEEKVKTLENIPTRGECSYRSYFHDRSDYLKNKTKQKQAYNGQIHLWAQK